MELSVSGWSFHEQLQIVHADVRLSADGVTLIDEPLCVDVGLPVLVRSAVHDTYPNRFAKPDDWMKMPFFVCGCGDPECRAYLFAVTHLSGGMVELIELEQAADGSVKEGDRFTIEQSLYAKQVREVALQFLSFIENKPYRPLFPGLVKAVEAGVKELKDASARRD